MIIIGNTKQADIPKNKKKHKEKKTKNLHEKGISRSKRMLSKIKNKNTKIKPRTWKRSFGKKRHKKKTKNIWNFMQMPSQVASKRRDLFHGP